LCRNSPAIPPSFLLLFLRLFFLPSPNQSWLVSSCDNHLSLFSFGCFWTVTDIEEEADWQTSCVLE
jgi:hypothetical protein